MKYYISLILFLFVANISQAGETRFVHVMVALCDNDNQGIVPVPPSIGNGQSPNSNLYWGAMYGVRTFFKKSANWQLIDQQNSPELAGQHILERLVFKHRNEKVYLVADAYDGAYIKQTTLDFIDAVAGQGPDLAQSGELCLPIKGGADLVAYVGHNGLMDFTFQGNVCASKASSKDAILLGCVTKSYFKDILEAANARPLVWTTGLMAPEAYTLEAALEGWVREEDTTAIRQRTAAAYHAYQKCGIRGARGLFDLPR